MARWEPDAQGRLQQAAMELFAERGYAEVTVAEIADRAGLTKRTFFNHFADKREVLFAGAQAFEDSVVAHLADPDDDLAPIDAATQALTRAGQELARYGEYARARQGLIASSTELQERDLIKTAALTSAIAEALRRRRVPATTATLTAQAAAAVFTAAYADWISDTGADLHILMQRSLDDLRNALGHTPAPEGQS
ncbi:AcrR family transcriptional regulator [Streptacidiphilus sp. BW17]|uniref:TetR/AcrR family transcriptional regulator n=1 Tax=Streptacidiphilus sp. BW17 TaxID=3156274 RepID=UPI0035140336